jgi:hypothetical protein
MPDEEARQMLARHMLALVRKELLRLARREDDLAASMASAVPYWAACPDEVLGHRRAAAALRADAEVVGAGSGFEVMAVDAEASPEAIPMVTWD